MFTRPHRTAEEELEFLKEKGARLLSCEEERARDRALKDLKEREESEKAERKAAREAAAKIRNEEKDEREAERDFANFMDTHLHIDSIKRALWRRLGVHEQGTILTIKQNHLSHLPLHKMFERNEALQRWREKKQRKGLGVARPTFSTAPPSPPPSCNALVIGSLASPWDSSQTTLQ